MPITDGLYRVLFEDRKAKDVVDELLKETKTKFISS